MTTEAELVLSTLTPEELIEANQWVTIISRHWDAMAERRGLEGTGMRTDGPWHLMTAMRLAVMAEMAIRGGADPWYLGMPTKDHPAGRMLDLYQQRAILLERVGDPRLGDDGVLRQTCVGCGQATPLTDGSFDRSAGMWSMFCRDCDRPSMKRLDERLARDVTSHDLPNFVAAQEPPP